MKTSKTTRPAGLTSTGFITIPTSKLHDIEDAVTQCFGYLTITSDLLARYMEKNGPSNFSGIAAAGVGHLADQTLQRIHDALDAAFSAAREHRES